MKSRVLLSLALGLMALSACSNNNGNNAAPPICGGAYPPNTPYAGFSPYNPTGYPTNPYQPAGYVNQSYYGYGAYQPGYPSGVPYGCAPGTQPIDISAMCGAGVPTPYAPTSYGQPYGQPYGTTYGAGYNQGYYGGGYGAGYGAGYNQGYYGQVGYGQSGIPGQTQMSCVPVNSISNTGCTGFGGCAPYYPSQYSWGAYGQVGYGPLQGCDSYNGYSCGPSAYCQPNFGQRYGYCVVHY